MSGFSKKHGTDMAYQIVGILLSVILIIVGLVTDASVWLLAGVVLLICSLGVVLGAHLRKKGRQ